MKRQSSSRRIALPSAPNADFASVDTGNLVTPEAQRRSATRSARSPGATGRLHQRAGHKLGDAVLGGLPSVGPRPSEFSGH
jgi:hypothetical protein